VTTPLIWREATPYPILASPDSCALCGTDQRRHCQHYFGRHLGDGAPKGYVAPDDATRLARMRARRQEATR
jgi:hypothetical protein